MSYVVQFERKTSFPGLPKGTSLSYSVISTHNETLHAALKFNGFLLDVYFLFVCRYGWMQAPKSSFPMPSAWAVLLLLEVTIPTTTTATGNDVHVSIKY